MTGIGRDTAARRLLEANTMMGDGRRREKERGDGEFRMPLHYPRYGKADYETMPEWMLDRLLELYGLPRIGGLAEKRRFAIGAFLWPPH